MNHIIISPSVLSMDFSRIGEQMNEINESKAEWIHFDVMDGNFVPNISFGPDILTAVRKLTKKYIDVHLMINNPMRYIPRYIEAGADLIIVHTESFYGINWSILNCIDYIHSFKVQAGIVVKPDTHIEDFEELLPYVDLVLIMSVEPGFGGQSFMEDQMEKVIWLKNKREELNLNYRIEVDGGINDVTAKIALDAGADTLVAGSYVFKNGIKESIEWLLNLK